MRLADVYDGIFIRERQRAARAGDSSGGELSIGRVGTRAGIQSIAHGQTEAALALGMSRWQTLRHVVLPQAFRVVIPPVTNDFIAMFKDSSIVSVITMTELTKVYGMLAMSTYDYIGLGLMTAGIYFALSYPASLFANWLETRLNYDRR
jgi:polar amino acid transport system substrate-binding protein